MTPTKLRLHSRPRAGISFSARHLIRQTRWPAWSSFFHVTVPAVQIDAIFAAHKQVAAAMTDVVRQPWGERAFHAELAGYRFLIAAEAAAE